MMILTELTSQNHIPKLLQKTANKIYFNVVIIFVLEFFLCFIYMISVIACLQWGLNSYSVHYNHFNLTSDVLEPYIKHHSETIVVK